MRPERAALYAILAAFLASWIATVGHIVLDSRPELAYPKPLYRNWDYVGSAAGADFGQI